MERNTRGGTPHVPNPYAKDDEATAGDAVEADSGELCPIAPLGISKNKADGTQENYQATINLYVEPYLQLKKWPSLIQSWVISASSR